MMLVAVMLMTACHSSEKNYREAYEKALERRQTGIAAETYAKIEAERQRYTHVINGDSVRMIYMNVNIAIDTTDVAKPFSVVAMPRATVTACARSAASRAATLSKAGPTSCTMSSLKASTPTPMPPRCSTTSTRKSASRSLNPYPGSCANSDQLT